MTPMEGGPYRETDTETPRYICPLCWRSASVLAPGVCRKCDVGRVPLDDPQVIDDVRKQAQRMLERRQAREWGIVAIAAIALTLATYYLGWRQGWLRHEFGMGNGSYKIGLYPAAIGVTISALVGVVYVGLFRRRNAAGDPSSMHLRELLNSLGVRIEE